MRRLTLVALTTAAAVIVLLVPASATAYDPVYYDDPGYTTEVNSMAVAYGSNYTGAAFEAGLNAGAPYASLPNAAAIRTGLVKARWAAKSIPAPRLAGAIGLGTSAFDWGWKVTRAADTKWLHFSDITTGEFGMDDTTGLVRDSPYGWEWNWSAFNSKWFLRVYSSYGSPCGLTEIIPSTFTGTLVDLWGGDRSTCKQFLLDAFTSLTSVVGTLGSTTTVSCPGSFFGSTYTGSAGTCYRIEATESEFANFLANRIDTFEPWTSQSETPQMSFPGGYEPGWGSQGFGSMGAQNDAFGGALTAEPDDSAGKGVDSQTNSTGSVENPLLEDTQEILDLYAPQLRYDSGEIYRADSAAEMTDNCNVVTEGINRLIDDSSEVIAERCDESFEISDLDLSFLGEYEAEATDYIEEANSYEDDWAEMHESSTYADKIYGRVVPGDYGHQVVQYWFFYYYQSNFVYGLGGAHEGDWEGIQITLDSAGTPTDATYFQHGHGERCGWNIPTKVNGQHPAVFVANESHASYFVSGTRELNLYGLTAEDRANGNSTNGSPIVPAVTDVTEWDTGWLFWPGRWGGTEASLPAQQSSPDGPSQKDDQWDDPYAWQANETCDSD